MTRVWTPLDVAEAEARAEELRQRYRGREGEALLAAVLHHEFPGRIALVSSFGAEAALLLDMVARVEPATPVIFLDTGKLFPETLEYRDALVARLGLTDVRSVGPDPGELAADDPDGRLHRHDPDLCCYLRKTLPLVRALRGFSAWITGRKRYQSSGRATLEAFEIQDGRIKVNPLAGYTAERVEREFARRDLPLHPLLPYGFASIGCLPCTHPVQPGDDSRAGRWRGLGKSECGIHLGADGRPQRSATAEPDLSRETGGDPDAAARAPASPADRGPGGGPA